MHPRKSHYRSLAVLQGKCLDLGTANQLIAASKFVSWTELEPFMLRMTEPLSRLCDPWNRGVAMAEAASLLLGLLLAAPVVSHAICNCCPVILLCQQICVICIVPAVKSMRFGNDMSYFCRLPQPSVPNQQCCMPILVACNLA